MQPYLILWYRTLSGAHQGINKRLHCPHLFLCRPSDILKYVSSQKFSFNLAWAVSFNMQYERVENNAIFGHYLQNFKKSERRNNWVHRKCVIKQKQKHLLLNYCSFQSVFQELWEINSRVHRKWMETYCLSNSLL